MVMMIVTERATSDNCNLDGVIHFVGFAVTPTTTTTSRATRTTTTTTTNADITTAGRLGATLVSRATDTSRPDGGRRKLHALGAINNSRHLFRVSQPGLAWPGLAYAVYMGKSSKRASILEVN